MGFIYAIKWKFNNPYLNQKLLGMLKTKDLIPILRSAFPPLNTHSKKGQNGRIAVIGGSFQFTGAPFYSAISSLKIGADLAHIFCSKSASTAIKSYSPEVIVHPVFVSQAEVKLSQQELVQVHNDWLSKILSWKSVIHSWVIGPGLGRDRYMNSFFPILVRNLPSGCIAVFDADGIYFLSKHPDLLPELKRFRTILTPNIKQVNTLKTIIELDIDHLFEKYKSEEEIEEIPCFEKLTDFSLVVKGRQDLILSNRRSFIVRTQGGQKRCGGLGDILSGAIAACSLWNEEYGMVLAARIMRMATKVAYQNEGRGLTAPSVIKQLISVVKNIQSASL